MDLKAVPFRSPLSAYEQQADGLLAWHRAADPAVIDLFPASTRASSSSGFHPLMRDADG
jgi:hypothetical protein